MNGDNIDAIGRSDLIQSLNSSTASAASHQTQSQQKPISYATTDKYYETGNEKRGVALIFNHFVFNNLKKRTGTNKDRDDIANVLNQLGFDVRIYNDLKYVRLIDVLTHVAKEDHTDSDCIVVVMLTHGSDGNLYASDSMYSVNELWNNFMGNNCKSLIGKPKLFFINACRGQKYDSGALYEKHLPNNGGDRVDSVIISKTVTYHIPQMADLLVMYSTFDGHFSWRNPEMGSWFIQALCTELLQNWQHDDLLTILTDVSRRVAYAYQSNVPSKYQMDCMKQMPCITSMLTKKFCFKQATKKI